MMEGQRVSLGNVKKTKIFRPASPGSEHEKFVAGLKLNELSLKERETVIEELHGVSDVVNEEPEVVQSCLQNIRQELNLDNTSTITDDTELLKFLRAESFDVKKAAHRFNQFAAFQKKLFGNQGRIRYSDLTGEDIKFLQSGFMQLLPQRDRAGRAILICIGSLKQQLKTPVETDLRCLSFLASKAAEDEETQKRGLVMVYYAISQKTYDGRNNRPLHLLRAFSELPARVVAAHLCYDNETMKPFIDLLAKHMGSKMLCRFRCHFGQHVECQYNLMTFGIPKECLPIDTMGQVDLTNHKMFLRCVELQEQKMDDGIENDELEASAIEGAKFLIPGHLDIVLGRGQHAKNTPGHLRFKQMLDENQARYESAEKSQKTSVADDILRQLKAAGCRFLKPRAEGGWVQTCDDVGREKINHAFRNLRNTSKKTSSPSQSPTPIIFPDATSSMTKKRGLDDLIDLEPLYNPEPLPLNFSGNQFSMMF